MNGAWERAVVMGQGARAGCWLPPKYRPRTINQSSEAVRVCPECSDWLAEKSAARAGQTGEMGRSARGHSQT